MNKTILYIFILFIIASICISFYDFKPANHYYNEAVDFEEKGEFQKAIEQLDLALQKEPEFRSALINRAADKLELGDRKGAIIDYKKIIEFDPNNTMVLMDIGGCYSQLNNYEKAIKYFSKSLNTKGAIKSDSSYIRLEISTDFDKDYEYHVRQYEIEFERGLAYFDYKDYQLAILDFKNVAKSNFENGSCYYWIGKSYLELNDTINACLNLKKSANTGITSAKELLDKNCEK